MERRPSSFRLLLTSLKLGCVGFGGGMAVLALLHREFVLKKKVCDEETFLNAAALSQALPGAISFNAMTYLGLSLRGFWGATVAGWGFMLPSFIMMIGLSIAYDRFSQITQVAQMLHGMVAGVVGVILAAAWDLSKKAAVRCRWGWVLLTIAFFASLLGVGVVEIVFGAGIAGLFLCAASRKGDQCEVKTRSVLLPSLKPLMGVLLGIGSFSVLLALGLFFLRVGLVTFGGGFVMIPMIRHEVVELHHWLTPRQFADGMALGQLTPGPVVITATFVGYKAAGLLGAWVASTAVFFPSYLLSLAFGFSLDRWKENPAVDAFMTGIQPAVVGLMGAAAILLGWAGISALPLLAVAFLSFLLLIRFRLHPMWIMAGSAVMGLLLG